MRNREKRIDRLCLFGLVVTVNSTCFLVKFDNDICFSLEGLEQGTQLEGQTRP